MAIITDVVNAPLAQMVEQLTLNQWAQGSSPWRCTNQKKALRESRSAFCHTTKQLSHLLLGFICTHKFRNHFVSLISIFLNNAFIFAKAIRKDTSQIIKLPFSHCLVKFFS